MKHLKCDKKANLYGGQNIPHNNETLYSWAIRKTTSENISHNVRVSSTVVENPPNKNRSWLCQQFMLVCYPEVEEKITVMKNDRAKKPTEKSAKRVKMGITERKQPTIDFVLFFLGGVCRKSFYETLCCITLSWLLQGLNILHLCVPRQSEVFPKEQANVDF